MNCRSSNATIPAWLLAAVVAAGMTAYAEDCDRPLARAKPTAPSAVTHDENPDADTGPDPLPRAR